MRERDIEKYLREQVRKAGGRAYKWESPGNAGVPDRIVIFPGNRILFVELKAPGKKPTKLQISQHRKLADLDCTVLVIDSKTGVDDFINRHAKVGDADHV
ncbi:VRR-NUC domain-containing protein [Schinkia azotoformans MEV2011]|uniref:VRR-NUC domain-containing protein n=1 Tax=Schinkia azotoformans MEV2011 TaxID=1348973 RepID=A0A072NSG9_SCHAZ|nr:VRR-NUC domain-containing protein [Schinkia azotoformans]KEF40431.1 VRR-NUC domain-containing protein [Schinkia azotoformans MEV2011]MEC1696160.1 VRR-NUC domain-containing protein [Schinkia azotoformans]MEC1716624.1 VRR-NUC domain-containing protein [Schinkia azotoformans]MEC1725337.1 VRR-NUC domain-containing protein [Schinkia azotoformans]MEC1739463.1 VRR-NUC domain-containing protein [Schinkia azotoformans]